MATYLVQAAYTSEAWEALTKNPQDRAALNRTQLQRLGGRLIDFYFSFGDYDTAVIFEAPDDTTAAAYAMSVAAPGFLKVVKTTKLLTVEEAMDAMRKAGAAPLPGPAATS